MAQELRRLTFAFRRSESDRALVEGIAYLSLDPPASLEVEEPEARLRIDSWGTWMRRATLEKFAHDFLTYGRAVDSHHDHGPVGNVVESYLTREGNPDYPPDVWVVKSRVYDAETLAEIDREELKGFSIEFFSELKVRTLLVGGAKVRTGEIVGPVPIFLSLVENPSIGQPFASVERRSLAPTGAVPELEEGAGRVTRMWRCAMDENTQTKAPATPAQPAATPTAPVASAIDVPPELPATPAVRSAAAPAAVPALAAPQTSTGTRPTIAKRDAAPTFDVGARVRVAGVPHMDGQGDGEVREAVLTYAYGVTFDGMPEMGIHHWYVESELTDAGAPDDQATSATTMGRAASAPKVAAGAVVLRRAAEESLGVERCLEIQKRASGGSFSEAWAEIAPRAATWAVVWEAYYLLNCILWNVRYGGGDDATQYAAVAAACDEFAVAVSAIMAAGGVQVAMRAAAQRAGAKFSKATRETLDSIRSNVETALTGLDQLRADPAKDKDDEGDEEGESAQHSQHSQPAAEAEELATLRAKVDQLTAEHATRGVELETARATLATTAAAQQRAEARVTELEARRPAPQSRTPQGDPGGDEGPGDGSAAPQKRTSGGWGLFRRNDTDD